MSKKSKKDPECSNCGIPKSQHFFGRMDRRCPGPQEEDRPLEMPSADPLGPTPSESLDSPDQSTKQTPEEEEELNPPTPPPPGFERVEDYYWEAVRFKHEKRPPVNKHTGIYAYHADDCLCSMAGWPCYRDGAIWSCCGETEKYCMCPGGMEKK